jgi:hypothetical protein
MNLSSPVAERLPDKCNHFQRERMKCELIRANKIVAKDCLQLAIFGMLRGKSFLVSSCLLEFTRADSTFKRRNNQDREAGNSPPTTKHYFAMFG